jgi:glucose-6-phosphate-specific signal transduction histidine kinase
MRERVWALHGDIAIFSDGGTRIIIRLPLPQDAA